jgi:hypothetical protein
MRRKEREIVDRDKLISLLERCKTMRLGFCDEGEPYVVPVSFGIAGDAIFVHSAPEGKKIDIIRREAQVCFEVDESELRAGSEPCEWGMRYASVIGWGKAEIVEDLEGKRAGLSAIMQHYGAEPPFRFGPSIERTVVIRIAIETMTGKASS